MDMWLFSESKLRTKFDTIWLFSESKLRTKFDTIWLFSESKLRTKFDTIFFQNPYHIYYKIIKKNLHIITKKIQVFSVFSNLDSTTKVYMYILHLINH